MLTVGVRVQHLLEGRGQGLRFLFLREDGVFLVVHGLFRDGAAHHGVAEDVRRHGRALEEGGGTLLLHVDRLRHRGGRVVPERVVVLSEESFLSWFLKRCWETLVE